MIQKTLCRESFFHFQRSVCTRTKIFQFAKWTPASNKIKSHSWKHDVPICLHSFSYSKLIVLFIPDFRGRIWGLFAPPSISPWHCYVPPRFALIELLVDVPTTLLGNVQSQNHSWITSYTDFYNVKLIRFLFSRVESFCVATSGKWR